MKLTRLLIVIFMIASLLMPSYALATTAPEKSGSHLALSEVHSLPDGGKAYVYNINGIDNVFPVPPKGFNPLTATDAQLQEYGFPTRPKDSKKLAIWQNDMSHYKQTPIPNVSMTQIKHKLKKKQTNNKVVNGLSYNWSGFYNYANSNTWTAVQGDFAQPTEQSDSAPNSYESAWVGLGGMNSGALIQAGTQMYNYNYNAWYEYLGRAPGSSVYEIDLPSVTVHPGDDIHVYVSYQTSNQVANFYVADNTTGTSQPVLVNLSSSNYYDGTTAEWIDERPTVNGSYAILADYGIDSWTNAQTYNTNGNWNSLGSSAYDYLIMVNTSGDALSYPGNLSLLTATSFNDYWNQGS